MTFIYLKSTLKCDSFDVSIYIKIQFIRVLVTIEPGRSLLQFVTTNCLIVSFPSYYGIKNKNYTNQILLIQSICYRKNLIFQFYLSNSSW